MGVSFVARKCTQCSGKLEYIKERKVWQCLYCGAEIERREQYDNLQAIKSAVKQTLLDLANRNLDSAAKNLQECEKVGAKYVGTLIAKIAYAMIVVTTPGACDQREARNHFSQLKKNYELLRDDSESLSEEEDVLYEFLDDADIFATLALVFDTLNDGERRDYILEMLDATQMYAIPANSNLLSYALKTGNMALADQVLENTNNLDIAFALPEVFAKYPDGEQKAQHISRLLGTGMLAHTQGALIEQYVSATNDGMAARAAAIEAAVRSGMEISLEFVIRTVLPQTDSDRTIAIMAAFCSKKLCDDDVLQILGYACSCKNGKTALGILQQLKAGKQYVFVPGKMMIAMLSDGGMRGEEKRAVLDQLFTFKVDTKNLEAVVTNYLCYNQDPPETRKQVIPYLLEKVPAVPTTTVQSYILKCTADGAEKPAIVQMLFDRGLNVSFFNDLLSKYMAAAADSADVKTAVVEILSGAGLKLDPGTLTDYISSAGDDVDTKIQFVRKMVANGSRFRGDAANAYLEKTPPDQFCPELFALICTPVSTFGPRAVERYLLYCRDQEAVKAKNFKMMADRCAGGVGAMRCTVSHLGKGVVCNLLQAYVLVSTDPERVTHDIVSWLIGQQRMKINAEVAAAGQSMKFKKYVLARKQQLSSITNDICEQYKVYTMLF